MLVGQLLRVAAPGKCRNRADRDAPLAVDAEGVIKHRVAGEFGRGKQGGKSDPGPYCGVRSILFSPKFPRPAQKAACRCEKNATGFSVRTSIDPYPSRGTQTEG